MNMTSMNISVTPGMSGPLVLVLAAPPGKRGPPRLGINRIGWLPERCGGHDSRRPLYSVLLPLGHVTRLQKEKRAAR